MRAILTVGLQCTVVFAAGFQSFAVGGDSQSQPTVQTAPLVMPYATISYPCVAPCSVPWCYSVCQPVACPAIPYCPVVCSPVSYAPVAQAANQNPAAPSSNPAQPAPALETPAVTSPVDPTGAAPSSVKVTAKQIDAILRCIDDLFEANADFQKCELMRVNPKQSDSVFGNKNKDWDLQGKAQPLTKTLWAGMHKEIYDAVHQNPQVAASFSPPVGLRVQISGTSCLPGQYVMLMFFERGVMQLYFNGKLVGECPVYDDQHWERILTQDGIPLPTASSAN
jgi:hypothetical protein